MSVEVLDRLVLQPALRSFTVVMHWILVGTGDVAVACYYISSYARDTFPSIVSDIVTEISRDRIYHILSEFLVTSKGAHLPRFAGCMICCGFDHCLFQQPQSGSET